MFKILEKKKLSEASATWYMKVEAPEIARNRKAGQFIILQVDAEFGERIPLTIADANAEEGWIALAFQAVGATSYKLSQKNVGDELPALLGPLGNPSVIEKKDGPVVVVGGGNVAMDAARTALRLGAETTIVYRRTEKELPARVEEVHHAKEEGIRFAMLTNPVEILGDENGWVKSVKCIRMELGEPDESGRRSPVEVPGSEFEIETDTVIMSLGTSPNPLIAKTTSGLETTRRGCLVADENGATTRPGVFAGGDAVTGAATVILAMGAGRKAATAIHQYIQSL